MLRLKFQNSGHLMPRADSLVKTLMLGKTEGKRSGWQSTKWLDIITDSVDMNLRKLRDSRGQVWWATKSMGLRRLRKGLSNRTTEAQGPCSQAQVKGASYLLDDYPE